ncbi:PLD nuclease N-terminal domain-containing protein [Pseudomonas syringae]|uniref:PLD nuclease N-terminal domain-containing protein n=1 Tax=Pseudomonas syringae TaxID=317 RepID=UPI00020992A8|nr:PLD nuclease N-terminal domain-containing protein [Pseudomonas syringae]EGH74633.1 hypothetical protein PSYAR_29176 [Pseudomonas syringae pv. aceris str. M302273]
MEAIISLLWLPFSLLILFANIVVIIGICRSQRSPGEKAAWSIGIMLFPVLGLIVWGVVGPRGIKPGTGPSSDMHSKG